LVRKSRELGDDLAELGEDDLFLEPRMLENG